MDRTLLVARQVFETWWIGVPVEFEERWIAEGSYWHAWDGERSISLSSTVLEDGSGNQVPAQEIMARVGALIKGESIVDQPGGLMARATFIDLAPDSRASRALSGIAAADGRLLTTTITSDDPAWAIGIWRTIRYQPPGEPVGHLPSGRVRLD